MKTNCTDLLTLLDEYLSQPFESDPVLEDTDQKISFDATRPLLEISLLRDAADSYRCSSESNPEDLQKAADTIQEAIKKFDEFNKNAPSDFRTSDNTLELGCSLYSVLGEIRRVEGNLEDAELQLFRALEMNPRDVFALCSHAEVLAAMGDFTFAIRELNTALEIDPDNQFLKEELRFLEGYMKKVSPETAILQNEATHETLTQSTTRTRRFSDATPLGRVQEPEISGPSLSRPSSCPNL